MNTFDNFVKFQVTLNEVPIAMDKSGKDIIVDWFFLDGFNTDQNLWLDSNGLQMVQKKLFYRRDWAYTSNNTISANYYPKTSAIAVRDHNPQTVSKTFQKQILIINDDS